MFMCLITHYIVLTLTNLKRSKQRAGNGDKRFFKEEEAIYFQI